MADGTDQKENFDSTWPILLSVVGGLFIPQWDKTEPPLLHFIDPPWRQILRLLSDQPIERIRAAALQIALAKIFALTGRPALAREFALTPIASFRRISSTTAVRERDASNDQSEAQHTGSLDQQDANAPERLTRLNVSFDFPRAQVDRWYETNDVAAQLLADVELLRGSSWNLSSARDHTVVQSPLGLALTLEVTLDTT